MTNNNLYFYPFSANNSGVTPNPYVRNLKSALQKKFRIVNQHHPSAYGIFDLVKYIGTIKYIFLNWIEDLPDKKGGKAQFFFFLMLIPVFRIKRIKVIWVLHNKESHYGKYRKMKRFLFKYLVKNADFILTHSSEGLRFLLEMGRKSHKKSIFLHHPVTTFKRIISDEREYDILIWGSIKEYKGIDRFLSFLYSCGLEKSYKILISGNVSPKSYKTKLKPLLNENITLIDEFISFEKVAEYASKSKIILFPYLEKSVLSSGALMDSIALGSVIIGPLTGAFKDVSDDGIIETYTDYNDLVTKIDKCLKNIPFDGKMIEFIEENSWENFSKKLISWLSEE